MANMCEGGTAAKRVRCHPHHVQRHRQTFGRSHAGSSEALRRDLWEENVEERGSGDELLGTQQGGLL